MDVKPYKINELKAFELAVIDVINHCYDAHWEKISMKQLFRMLPECFKGTHEEMDIWDVLIRLNITMVEENVIESVLNKDNFEIRFCTLVNCTFYEAAFNGCPQCYIQINHSVPRYELEEGLWIDSK